MVIKKLPNQNIWRLYSKKTHKILGTFSSKSAALKRERQIQYFKNLKN